MNYVIWLNYIQHCTDNCLVSSLQSNLRNVDSDSVTDIVIYLYERETN